jgi:polysaccharide pyruvyl transferase WcaK-like protein
MQSVQIKQTSSEPALEARESGPRIALITPYDGGNLGDAAIQDSMISNLRLRIPGAQFFGITLGCENFIKQHGAAGAFPLLATMLPFSSASAKSSSQHPGAAEQFEAREDYPGRTVKENPLKRVLRTLPGLLPLLKRVRASSNVIRREVRHSLEGFKVLRTQDVLFISGGGQLDEEYGGAWRLPFTIFKWALLARLAGVPCAMASIGAGKITLPNSRRFVSMALRMCCYRSFREQRSRAIVAKLFPRAKNDSVVPDLAFSMPESEIPSSTGIIRKLARGKPVVALSPIAYAKPVNWPTPDRDLHDRYVQNLAAVIAGLVRRDCFIVVVCSSLGDDESVIPEILERLDDETKQRLDGRIHFPAIKTWRELATVLRDADYLIASRLHGTILGFLTRTPVVAISFDPKVDWVMEDLRQTDYLLHIRDFTADDVLKALDRVEISRNEAVARIAAYRAGILSDSVSAQQYDFLAGIALKRYQSHN